MNDPIVDEVREVFDRYAARFNYDVRAMFQDIKEKERRRGLKFVDGAAVPIASASSGAPVNSPINDVPQPPSVTMSDK